MKKKDTAPFVEEPCFEGPPLFGFHVNLQMFKGTSADGSLRLGPNELCARAPLCGSKAACHPLSGQQDLRRAWTSALMPFS